MHRDRIKSSAAEDSAKTFGEDSTKHKIVMAAIDTGLQHTDMLEGRGATGRAEVRKNRKAEKQRCYEYLKDNVKVTPQMVGCGVIATALFWFLVKQALWWLASHLINSWLFKDDDDDE